MIREMVPGDCREHYGGNIWVPPMKKVFLQISQISTNLCQLFKEGITATATSMRPASLSNTFVNTGLIASCMSMSCEEKTTLLDKVGCRVGDFQMDQRHLMLKVSLKRPTRGHILSQKEGVYGTKHFYWAPLYGIRSVSA